MSESEDGVRHLKKPVMRRLPPWLKKAVPSEGGAAVNACLDELNIDTVCRGARCPNSLDCKSRGRAAFLILGPQCTRACRFCAMESGEPSAVDEGEPRRLAEAVKCLGLRHAVVTSVTRDDLPDGGAGHFAAVVGAIRELTPGTTVEILVPDFWGDEEAWGVASDSEPDVFNHNIETVERLYPLVRPEADFDRSLALLDFAKERYPRMKTKSGMMLGLGEEMGEVLESAEALRDVGVDIITVGQYLQPRSERTVSVKRYVPPEEFAELEKELLGMGFGAVACGPFVRSSYNAEETFLRIDPKNEK